VHLPALLVAAGLAISTSAARRLIDEGGVRLDGTPVAARAYEADAPDLAGRVLSVGKRRAVRLIAR
jgi:tyrosyl-tRNA synthetase